MSHNKLVIQYIAQIWTGSDGIIEKSRCLEILKEKWMYWYMEYKILFPGRFWFLIAFWFNHLETQAIKNTTAFPDIASRA